MSAPVAEGDIVLEKYRVERVLGQGGMGIVVAATHVDLAQKVALKFLLPSALDNAELVERFAREAKAAAKIQSQHVVRVLDTGKMPSGAPFMVMEYLEGEDLGAILKRSGALAPNAAADYLLQACEAIGEAHAAGIVHRDLKPSNLFLAKQRDRRSIVKVLDFGISKLEEPNAAPLTLTSSALGSPHYMSPEQLLSSKNVDARSDIWSLGVSLYELVAGTRPFDGDTMPEVVGQILNNEPERLSTLRAGVSLDFELVVARCLQTDTNDRYQSVAELASALRPFATDAVAAAASVERITRVLGGASIPPAALAAAADARLVLMVDLPPSRPEEVVTVRPAALPSPSPSPSPEIAHAATTPSNEVSKAVEIAKAKATAPPKRRGILAAGGVALCLLVFVGMRAGMSRPTAPVEVTPASTSSAPAPAVVVSETPSASSSASAAPATASASSSSSPSPPPPLATARPTSRPSPVTSSSAAPKKDALHMDIK